MRQNAASQGLLVSQQNVTWSCTSTRLCRMEVESRLAQAPHMQHGVVVRLNLLSGFGYVADAEMSHFYIFVVGKALNHAEARKLKVGMSVRFRTSGRGRVDELIAA